MSNELFVTRIHSPLGEIKAFMDFRFDKENIFSGMFVIFGKRLTIADGIRKDGRRTFSVDFIHNEKTVHYSIDIALSGKTLKGSINDDSGESMPMIGNQYFNDAAYLNLR